MGRITCIVALFIAIAFLFVAVEARSDRYYDMITAMIEGKDYYKLLNVSKTSPADEIKKSFRKLSLIYHPDKNKSPDATKIFMGVSEAYAILSDPDLRAEYDELLVTGVPWHEAYYGRHMHRWGAPEHDIRYVLLYLYIFLNVGKYAYQWYRHRTMVRLIKSTPQYKMKLNQYRQSMGLDKKKKNDSDVDDEEPPILAVGAEPPEWKDILTIQIVRGLYNLTKFIGTWIYCRVTGKEMETVDYDELQRLKLKMTKEEYELEKKKAVARMEKFKTSSKMKRYRRFMKTHEPVNHLD